MPDTDLTARVQAGVEVLDREYPRWDAKIDLGQLDLGNPHSCVLGQLYGHYIPGARTLFTPVRPGQYGAFDTAVLYGFDALNDDETYDQEAQYDDLTVAWREVIEKRRG